MNVPNSELDPIENLASTIKTLGILFIVLGFLGLLIPQIFSFVVEMFFGFIMLAGGLIFAYYSYQYPFSSFIDWLKPLILMVTGILLLIFPTSGVAAFILLLSLYFFTDAFASFALSYERHPRPGWFWMTLNGIFSALLAILILIGWPESSMFYLGIFIGISLLLDGFALYMLGRSITQASVL